MEKIDLRHVSKETRETIRKQVVSLLKKKMKHADIADTLSISKIAVDKISKAYKAKGSACIKEKTRGRKFGDYSGRLAHALKRVQRMGIAV